MKKYRKALVVGSFDLTHAGHFHLFECAAVYADEVHVGVASDALVREFKGEDRPIYPIEQRIWIIERCKHVTKAYTYGTAPDATKEWNHSAQISLVNTIKPDVFVEGEDKQGEVLHGWLESQGIKRISTPRLSPEITTTHFVNKIRNTPEAKVDAMLKARGDVSSYYYPDARP